MNDTQWHALPLTKIATELKADLEKGLSKKEAAQKQVEGKAEEPQQEEKEAKQASKKATGKETQAEEAAEKKGKTAEKEKKIRKISRMTLAEVEKKLKAAEESMGNLQSDYARHLLKRKKELTQTSSKP